MLLAFEILLDLFPLNVHEQTPVRGLLTLQALFLLLRLDTGIDVWDVWDRPVDLGTTDGRNWRTQDT